MFAAAATRDSFELRAEAALRSIPSAALALVSAAATHGWGPPADQIDLAVPPGGRNRLEGTRIVQTPLPAGHVVGRNGWRVTSVERTLVDLGRVLSVVELQRCIADRVIERRTTMARVEAMFAELATRGRPGIARVRRALSALDDHPPAESELEAMFLRLVRRTRLPAPAGQASFDWLDGGRGRVDFWYPAHALIVELDGRRFHLRVADFERDRRRDQLALAHGIRTVRITHRQLTTEGADLRGLLAKLLAA